MEHRDPAGVWGYAPAGGRLRKANRDPGGGGAAGVNQTEGNEMARMKKAEIEKRKAKGEMCLRLQEGALFVSAIPFSFPEVSVEAQAAYDALVKLALAVQ